MTAKQAKYDILTVQTVCVSISYLFPMLWQYSTGVVTSIDFSALYGRAVGTGGQGGGGQIR